MSTPQQNSQNINRLFSQYAQRNSVPYSDENSNLIHWLTKFLSLYENILEINNTSSNVNIGLQDMNRLYIHTPQQDTEYSINISNLQNVSSTSVPKFILIINMQSTLRTITFANNISWLKNAPVINEVNKKYFIEFISLDNGTNWIGSQIGVGGFDLQLTQNKVLISNNNGQIDTSNVTSTELSYLSGVSSNIQNQIDTIVAASDVKDIVGTYTDLQNYDTSTLGNNDIIKVLSDSTHNNAMSYYRWSTSTSQFTYIGSEGPYYTKGEANTNFVPKTTTINNKTLSSDITLYGTDVAMSSTDVTTIKSAIDSKQATLTAGNGINITNNVISMKGVQVMPNGTDIDTLINEGTYYVISPTSTLGLPDIDISSSSSLSHWEVLVKVEKLYFLNGDQNYTLDYVVNQTVTFFGIQSGPASGILSAPFDYYTRVLGDTAHYTYIEQSWVQIPKGMTAFTDLSYSGNINLTPIKNYYYILHSMSNNNYIKSLTLTDIPNTPQDIYIQFIPLDTDFTLTETQLTWLNQPKPINFIPGKTYIIHIKNLCATISNTGVNQYLSDYVDYNKTNIIVDGNITASKNGWQGFSATNYLTVTAPELESGTKLYTLYMKFTVNVTKTNTLLYCNHINGNTYSILGVNNDNKLFITNYYNNQYNTTTSGSVVLQNDKTYWIRTIKSTGTPYPIIIYLIEDNNYTINTLPSQSSWTYALSDYNAYFNVQSEDVVYIGYNPITTANYFDGVIEYCYIESILDLNDPSSFTNINCIKGTKLTVPEYIAGSGITITNNVISAQSQPALLTYFTNKSGTSFDTDLDLTSLQMIFNNGILLKPTSDYTISGSIITFTTSLLSSDIICVVTGSVNTVPIPTTEIITSITPSLTLQVNINYKCTNALTSLTINSVPDSPLETNIYFTTGNSFTFTNSSNMIKWLGNIPTFNANTEYVLNICNNIGAVAEIVTETI